jgi:hypothetical protein
MNTQVAFSLRGRNPDVLTCIGREEAGRILNLKFVEYKRMMDS